MAGFNAFDTFNSARQASYDGLNQVRQDRGRMQAGQALQAGDYKGAAGALYGAGDLQAGMQVQQGQEHQQDRQMEMAQQQQKLAAQQAAQKAEQMKRMALALRDVPPEQRAQVFQTQVGPALIQLGMKPEDLNGAEDHLDDASLGVFAGEMDKQIQAMNLGNGGLATFNNRTGEVNVVREPYRDPLKQELTQAQIEATRAQVGQRQASAYASRKNADRPRAAGKGGAASPAGNSTLDAIAAELRRRGKL